MTLNPRSRSDIKRDAIIEAAKHAFQKFGVNGTSMDKLAELANVSKRTVYNHFAAKEELVMHLIKEQWHSVRLNMGVVYDTQIPIEEQLISLFLANINFMSDEDHLELSRVAIGYFFYQADRLREEVTQLQAAETAIHRWLNAAKQDGKVAFDDLAQVTDEIDSLIKGQCFWPQLFKIDDPLTEERKLEIAESTAALIISRYATGN